ncbi:MAG: hypothetical protein K9N46_01100 [Candidatus Marinimicrobia bacterium]|nr:hypothetical protein [Candidatus Neomarinimicrobiota bacterium]MCF7827927.1 hypothetical protein [Candidatus Neomarinimicrobiota bacterium]MCF7879318.1 hypothetical protein [Candidatus Neomarinimicrobiota bacterium]
MIRILIHGITTKTDALAAAKLGANGLGFILDKSDERYIEFTLARDILHDLPPVMCNFLQVDDYDTELLRNMVQKLRIGALIIPIEAYKTEFESLGCRLTLTGTAEEILDHASTTAAKRQYLPRDVELGQLHDKSAQALQIWRDVNEAHHLLIPCKAEPATLPTLLDRFKPAGLFFQGGTESHTGLQDYPRIQAYIQAIHSIVERV